MLLRRALVAAAALCLVFAAVANVGLVVEFFFRHAFFWLFLAPRARSPTLFEAPKLSAIAKK